MSFPKPWKFLTPPSAPRRAGDGAGGSRDLRGGIWGEAAFWLPLAAFWDEFSRFSFSQQRRGAAQEGGRAPIAGGGKVGFGSSRSHRVPGLALEKQGKPEVRSGMESRDAGMQGGCWACTEFGVFWGFFMEFGGVFWVLQLLHKNRLRNEGLGCRKGADLWFPEGFGAKPSENPGPGLPKSKEFPHFPTRLKLSGSSSRWETLKPSKAPCEFGTGRRRCQTQGFFPQPSPFSWISFPVFQLWKAPRA